MDCREIEKSISNEFENLSFAREAFPMLTTWGVEDSSLTIHSLGCNYLSAFGRDLGFWATSEYPVKIRKKGKTHFLRPDVVWWSKRQAEVALIGEFERFESGQKQKLVNKALNC